MKHFTNDDTWLSHMYMKNDKYDYPSANCKLRTECNMSKYPPELFEILRLVMSNIGEDAQQMKLLFLVER
jgi:hypothetical protein